jgi:hypothetical protein
MVQSSSVSSYCWSFILWFSVINWLPHDAWLRIRACHTWSSSRSWHHMVSSVDKDQGHPGSQTIVVAQWLWSQWLRRQVFIAVSWNNGVNYIIWDNQLLTFVNSDCTDTMLSSNTSNSSSLIISHSSIHPPVLSLSISSISFSSILSSSKSILLANNNSSFVALLKFLSPWNLVSQTVEWYF